MEGVSRDDVVVVGSLVVCHCLPGKDQSLLRGRDTFFFFDPFFDSLDGVGRVDVDVHRYDAVAAIWRRQV